MGPEEALCGWVTVLGTELTFLVDRGTMFELAKLGQLEPSLHSPKDSSVSTSQLGRMEGMRKLRQYQKTTLKTSRNHTNLAVLLALKWGSLPLCLSCSLTCLSSFGALRALQLGFWKSLTFFDCTIEELLQIFCHSLWRIPCVLGVDTRVELHQHQGFYFIQKLNCILLSS